ncbi:hypothetical protein [Xylophilus sp. GOD-11R]|uniref:hypothetical protein n=1 Tax=Xylophilus sp. GOD-11R TaxID=3089814 RepID=UPI00298C8DD6|nr:hypothetical protein [Xylophilus sp. GOD-11R]WPB57261.1 hypothetical protein R9X41_00970 [Xylophilus sp. GOD-11R]
MMTLSRKFLSPALLIPAIAYAVLVSICVGFITHAFIDVYYLDGLMMVKAVVQKHYEGTLTFSDVFVRWEQHRLPIYALFSILNAELFGLNAVLEPYAYLASYCLLGVCLYRPFLRSVRELVPERSETEIGVSYALILSCVFSLTHHPYHMMTTQFVWGTVTFALSALVFDRICHGLRGWWHVIGFAAIFGLYLLMGGAYMGGAVLSMIVGFALLCLRGRPSAESVVAFAASMVLSAIYIFSNPQSGTLDKIIGLIETPLESTLAVMTGLSTATLDQHTLTDRLHLDHRVLVANGAFLLGLGLLALWRYARLQAHRTAFAPVMFMAYTVGVILSIRIGRLEAGWTWPLQQWYHFHMMLYVIGVIWIMSIDIMGLRRKKSPWATPLVAMLVVLIAVQTYSNAHNWKRAYSIHGWLQEKQKVMLDPTEDTIDLLLWMGDRKDAMETVEFLKQNRLSAFRNLPDPQPGSR